LKTEEAVKGVAIVAGVAGVGYLVYDSIKHANDPAAGSRSLISSAAGSIAQTVATADVPAIKTGMPMFQAGRIIDPPNNRYNNMVGVAKLCNEILCNNASENGGMVAAAFASCEVQNGRDLSNNCHNASLFNVHWRPGMPYPRVRIGTEIMPSFTTGKPDLLSAYRECITFWKNWLLTTHPNDGPRALQAIMAGDPRALQISIARMNYNSTYTATVTNGVITGTPFIHDRLSRLIQQGLI